MKAIITVGVSGCGKSTWAKSQAGFHQIERDSIRKAIFAEKNPGEEFTWAKWKWNLEDEVTKIQNEYIEAHAKAGNNIIISDTNLNQTRAESLRQKLYRFGYSTDYKFFHGNVNTDSHIDIETCIKRDAARELSVGAHVIHKQWKQMIYSWDECIYQQNIRDTELPKAIIVDIDGTVADHEGIRGAFEWGRVGEDFPRRHVINLIISYMCCCTPVKLIFLSGRDSVCCQETQEWLEKHFGLFEYQLYMRGENDTRNDAAVKLELFDKHIRGVYDVEMVFDDRKRVVQLWTDIGLNVINVGHINDYF